MGYAVYYQGEIEISPALKSEDSDLLLQIIADHRTPAQQEAYRIHQQMNENRGEFSNLLKSFPLSLDEDKHHLVSHSEEQIGELEDWLSRLIEYFFAPRGYSLEGEVHRSGDGEGDHGYVYVKQNKVEYVEDVCFNDGPSWARTSYMSEPVQTAAGVLVGSADDTGCDGDLTVCFKSAVDTLNEMLNLSKQSKNGTVPTQSEVNDGERTNHQ